MRRVLGPPGCPSPPGLCRAVPCPGTSFSPPPRHLSGPRAPARPRVAPSILSVLSLALEWEPRGGRSRVVLRGPRFPPGAEQTRSRRGVKEWAGFPGRVAAGSPGSLDRRRTWQDSCPRPPPAPTDAIFPPWCLRPGRGGPLTKVQRKHREHLLCAEPSGGATVSALRGPVSLWDGAGGGARSPASHLGPAPPASPLGPTLVGKQGNPALSCEEPVRPGRNGRRRHQLW